MNYSNEQLSSKILEMKDFYEAKDYANIKVIVESIDEQIDPYNVLSNKVLYYAIKADMAKYFNDYLTAYKSMLSYTECLKLEHRCEQTEQDTNDLHMSKLERIASIGSQMTIANDIPSLLENIMEDVSEILVCNTIAIFHLEGETVNSYHYRAYSKTHISGSYPLNEPKSLSTSSIRNNKEIIMNDFLNEYKAHIPDYISYDKKHNQPESIHSCMFFPLHINNETIGAFSVQSQYKDAYSQEAIVIFRILCSYMSIALYNLFQKQTLKNMAHKDLLTGLLNQRGFLNRFQTSEIMENKTITLIIIDSTLLQTTNRKYGHLAGDYVLEQIGHLLDSYSDNTHIFSRINGEEFDCLLLNLPYKEAVDFAEKLYQEIVALDIRYYDIDFKITPQIGLCHVDAFNQFTYNDIYRCADLNLQKAKESETEHLIASQLSSYFFT